MYYLKLHVEYIGKQFPSLNLPMEAVHHQDDEHQHCTCIGGNTRWLLSFSRWEPGITVRKGFPSQIGNARLSASPTLVMKNTIKVIKYPGA